ncbi:LEA type 2 family protein [Hymenobacter sp.]|jgi:LEA14-like dessication related protein|uniref:LEA type 2 family protein n=1 Tax=Hymenobacter sp. TaxID=1898978 RepID=UPI002EDAD1A8
MATRPYYQRHPVVFVFALLLLLLVGVVGWVYVKNDKGKGLLPTLADKGKELLPTLENTSLAVSSMKGDSVKAQVKLDVRNNMPITLRIDSFRYQTRLDGDLLTQGARNTPTVLSKDSISHLQLPLALDLSKMKNKLQASQQDCVDVQLAMDLYTRLPVAGTKKIPVTLTKRIFMPKMPTLENVSFSVNNITPDYVYAQMVTDIRNHMPITLRIDSLSYRTSVDGRMLASGHKGKPTVLKGKGLSHMQVPVTLDLSKIKNTIKTSQQDCVDVKMVMNLYARLPMAEGTQRIPVNVTKRVYVPKLPKIEVADIDVEHLGLKNGEAIVNLKVTNYNPFPVTIRRVSYDFRVSDDMQVRGVEEKDVSFATRGTEMMPIRVKFEPKGLPKVGYKTLFRAKKTPYNLKGSVVVAAGKNNPKDMTMQFNSAGTLKELKNIPK